VGHECCGAASASFWNGGGGFSPSRRTFFNMWLCLLEAFHFLPLPMDLPRGDCAIRSSASMCRSPIFLPSWMGCALLQLSDIHIGDYMPPREIARAVDMANELQPDISLLRETSFRAKAIRWTSALPS